MIDTNRLRDIAIKLQEWARQIRHDAEAIPHATSKEDSGLLDGAAKEMREAADEIERLRAPQSK